MPSNTLRRSLRTLVVVATVTTGLVAAGAGSASAAKPCTDRDTHAAFEEFGDEGQYFLVQNGDFEQSTAGWKLGRRVRTVARQAPWRVNGEDDSRALRLPPGRTARIRLCVTEREDTLRFFVRTPARGGSLKVVVKAQVPGEVARNRWTMHESAGGWHAAPAIAIPTLRRDDGKVWITISFRNTGRTPILLDDVMIDPWVAR
jgi:hypothetical protein